MEPELPKIQTQMPKQINTSGKLATGNARLDLAKINVRAFWGTAPKPLAKRGNENGLLPKRMIKRKEVFVKVKIWLAKR